MLLQGKPERARTLIFIPICESMVPSRCQRLSYPCTPADAAGNENISLAANGCYEVKGDWVTIEDGEVKAVFIYDAQVPSFNDCLGV